MWGTFWPLLLVLGGIAMLMRPRSRRRDAAEAAAAPPGAAPSPSGAEAAGAGPESIASSNVFGDVDVRVASPRFRGGSASTVFGDVTVDAHQGILADGEYTLTVSGVFGDSRVTVPPGAALDIAVHTLAGDVSVLDQKRSGISASLHFTTPGFESAPKRLHVNVSQVFGDIDVRQ